MSCPALPRGAWCWTVDVEAPVPEEVCTRFLFDDTMTDILREGCKVG